MKYYFFRDLDNESNRNGNLSCHPAGIIEKLVNPKGTFSGKELAVIFFEPFNCNMKRAWRCYEDVELFEVEEHEYEYLLEEYLNTEKLMRNV